MIVSLRGTHGSGKSTVANKIISKYGGAGVWGTSRKAEAYQVDLPDGWPLFIIGDYSTPCGGCDGIQPYSDIWPLVAKYAELGHVLFEGALVSTTYGSIGVESERYHDNFVFAFMDTPLELCVERVNARRAAKGKPPLGDNKNIEAKWHTILRLQRKLETGEGLPRRPTATISNLHPVKDVLRLFGTKIAKEPK